MTHAEEGEDEHYAASFMALPEHVWRRENQVHISVTSSLRRDWLLHHIHYKRRGIDGTTTFVRHISRFLIYPSRQIKRFCSKWMVGNLAVGNLGSPQDNGPGRVGPAFCGPCRSLAGFLKIYKRDLQLFIYKVVYVETLNKIIFSNL